eukprot:1511499-Pleurochrysis_carterae.AAC.4
MEISHFVDARVTKLHVQVVMRRARKTSSPLVEATTLENVDSEQRLRASIECICDRWKSGKKRIKQQVVSGCKVRNHKAVLHPDANFYYMFSEATTSPGCRSKSSFR